MPICSSIAFPAGMAWEAGHSLGNLIVTALYQKSGNLGQAVEALGSLLRLNGRAFPVAESQMTLCAEFYDGAVVRGESQITAVGRRTQRVWIEPDDPQPCPGVVEVCLVHNRPITQATWNGGEPVPCDLHRITSLGAAPVGADLIRPGFRIRHDAAKLGRVISSVAQGRDEHV